MLKFMLTSDLVEFYNRLLVKQSLAFGEILLPLEFVARGQRWLCAPNSLYPWEFIPIGLSLGQTC